MLHDDDLTIPVSIFKNALDKKPTQHNLAWHALAQRLCRYEERANKDGGAWSPVTYLPGTTRGKANVDQVFALVLDIDHAALPEDLLEGREMVAHTTHSHTPEAPRWRVILPLVRPISGMDWPAFWLRAQAQFGGCVDPATKDSSRIFYLPSCPPGAQHEVKQQHGTLLDPEDLPVVPVYTAPRIQVESKPGLLQRYLASWAAQFVQSRVDALASMGPDSGRNAECNRTAHTIAGLLADTAHDLTETTIVDQLVDACHRNGLIADDGERSVMATIRSGLESGRARPWSPADQDPPVSAPSMPQTPLAGAGTGGTHQQRHNGQSEQSEQPSIHVDVVRMDTVQPEVIDWLWRGRIARGKATLMIGDPGLGKSLISHWLAAIVSRGGQWPDGGDCDQGSAILLTIEDGLADTVRPRLETADAVLQRVVALRAVIDGATVTERMFALEQHLNLLEQLIRAERATLVVFDPITAYLGPNINAHKEDDVRRVLGPLQLMAERSNVALLLLMHLNKGSGINALYRASGSIAFPAVCRLVLGVAVDPNDDDQKRRLLLPIKLNIGETAPGIGYRIRTTARQVLARANAEDQPPELIWDNEPINVEASAAMDRAGTAQDLGQLAEAKRVIVQIRDEIFADGGDRILSRDAERMLKEAGVSTAPAILVRARRDLGIKVTHQGKHGPWWWVFPSDVMSPRAHAREETPDTRDSRNSRNDSEALHFHDSNENPRESSRARAREADDSEQELRFCAECQVHLVVTSYAQHLTERHPRGERCPVHGQYFDEHECDAIEEG